MGIEARKKLGWICAIISVISGLLVLISPGFGVISLLLLLVCAASLLTAIFAVRKIKRTDGKTDNAAGAVMLVGQLGFWMIIIKLFLSQIGK